MSGYNNILPMTQLNDRQIDAICELHQREIPTLLAKLGKPFLQTYYKTAIQDPDVIAISALDPNGRVIGWAIGSTHPAELTLNLRANTFWFLSNLFWSILRDPSLIIELAGQIRPNPINQLSDRQIELTYIGVHPEARSKGVGAALLTQFLDRTGVFGARSVLLSVEVENQTALRFYQKHGFRSIQTFREGKYERQRLFLLLDPQKAIP